MASETLKPQFFVTRQNGDRIPLIAMDELPAFVKIRGVGRSLSQDESFDVMNVGTFSSRHLQHIVENLGEQIPVSKSIDTTQNAASRAGSSSSSTNTSASGRRKAYGIQEQAPSPSSGRHNSVHTNDTTNGNTTRSSSLPPWQDLSKHGLQRAPGVKEFCSYWLRHGECDFAQQGCVYKHEMPLDKETLKELGLRELPKWYREEHGISSRRTVVSQTDNEHRGRKDQKSRNWRVDELKANVRRDTSTTGTEDDQVIVMSRGRRSKGKNTSNPRPPAKTTKPFETMKERQQRISLAQLDEYDRREKQRKAQLVEKMRDANMSTSEEVNCKPKPTTSTMRANATGHNQAITANGRVQETLSHASNIVLGDSSIVQSRSSAVTPKKKVVQRTRQHLRQAADVRSGPKKEIDDSFGQRMQKPKADLLIDIYDHSD